MILLFKFKIAFGLRDLGYDKCLVRTFCLFILARTFVYDGKWPVFIILLTSHIGSFHSGCSWCTILYAVY